MENKYLNGILVVEGKNDKALLSTFVKTPIFCLNGFECKNSLINFLKNVSLSDTILILCDPDVAGDKISSKIKEKISNSKIIYAKNPIFNKTKKRGIAEMKIDYLVDLLNDFYIAENRFVTNIDLSFLVDLFSKISKQNFINDFNLFNSNNKTLLLQLSTLKINKKTIMEKYENK